MKKHIFPALLLLSVSAPAFADEPAAASTLQGRLYEEYNGWREPCQNYQEPPAGATVEKCHLAEAPKEPPAPPAEPAMAQPAPTPPPAPVRETRFYTVYFGVNQSKLSESARRLVAQAADEIKGYNDVHVTVSGYASKPSTDKHNFKLSQKRAAAVTAELVADGVSRAQLSEEAFGEANLAVPTPDKTEMPANRRAVITFTGWKAKP